MTNNLCLKEKKSDPRVTGRQFEFMGETVEGNMELTPEEALYLMECSQLGMVGYNASINQSNTTLLSMAVYNASINQSNTTQLGMVGYSASINQSNTTHC